MPRTFHNDYTTYFLTGTVVSWMDVFTRPIYSDIFVDSCNYCVNEKGLIIHSYVLMTNHFHMLASTEEKRMKDIIQSMKRFTARKVIEAIEQNPQESRKDWLLSGFRNCVKDKGKDVKHQFWQHKNHPVPLWNQERLGAAINYIHTNPVKAGYVESPDEWRYSSAKDYSGKKGLVKVELLDNLWITG